MALHLENMKCASKFLTGRPPLRLRLGVRGLHGPTKQNEYTATAVYPKISPSRDRNEENTHRTKEAVKSLKTVEEKMYQINRPKMFGWYTFMLRSHFIMPDTLDWTKFATCTHVIDGLPTKLQYNKDTDKSIDSLISQIGAEVEQAILNEEYVEYKRDVSNDKIYKSEKFASGKETLDKEVIEKRRSDFIIKRIHNVIQSHLAPSNPHIMDAVEDYSARRDAFWFRGGIMPDKLMLGKRLGNQRFRKEKAKSLEYERIKQYGDELVYAPYERCIQIHDKPVIQMRHELPLEQFLDRDDALCTQVQFPIADLDPRSYGFTAECQHGTNIPGHWPQDSNRMGLLSYHNRINKYESRRIGSAYPNPEEMESLGDEIRGIMSNFAWTMGQAVQLGFSPLNELTFPLASQSVNTDGKSWSFYAYQMNTCDLSENDHNARTHQNLMWKHPTVQLYSKIEDGKLVNFDPDCLRPLIKMYLNKPKERAYNMRPYLDPAVPLVTDHPDPYQRKQFLEIIRNQMAQKPHSMRKPEIYMWEKVKLIDNVAMPKQFALTRRRRWWHMHKFDPLGKEHWHPEFVNYDQKELKYIPKGMRPAWTRRRGLARRYNKFLPKIEVPLKDKVAVWRAPDRTYKGEHDD